VIVKAVNNYENAEFGFYFEFVVGAFPGEKEAITKHIISWTVAKFRGIRASETQQGW
jgi:hypothetical protein